MTILKARSHMISVRLSEDEYAALLNLCVASGARSVSDFAREAMRMFARVGDKGYIAHPYAEGLQAQIQSLDLRLTELSERITEDRVQGLKSKPGNATA